MDKMALIDRLPFTRIRSSGVSTPEGAGSAQRLVAAQLSQAAADYRNVSMAIDQNGQVAWCFMQPSERPSYTQGLLTDLGTALCDLPVYCRERESASAAPLSWLVMASKIPGIFNLGGDLKFFAESIRSKDHAALRDYAYACIDNIYGTTIGFGLPLITIALVQGDALGGGFEHALACDVIVAERGAKFGFPEVLFNMFPGMGAYSFLSRRLDPRRAEAMISSGKIYDASELHQMGLVDVLADNGEGVAAVRNYIANRESRRNAYLGLLRARRCADPITHKELTDIVDIWVETASSLAQGDLCRMDRLVRAQDRRTVALGSPVDMETSKLDIA